MFLCKFKCSCGNSNALVEVQMRNNKYHIVPLHTQCLTGVFSKDVVWRQAKTLPAHIWWQKFGSQCPTLRWIAMRVLAQTTSAAAAESAWSEFDFVFNRRRNALGKERASKLVFVHCNLRLLRKFQSRHYNEDFHAYKESDDESDEPNDDNL